VVAPFQRLTKGIRVYC